MAKGELKSAYTFKPRKDENELVKKFLMNQGNFQDAVRYLIEKEIAQNGIRDLETCIPAVRDIEVLMKEFKNPVYSDRYMLESANELSRHIAPDNIQEEGTEPINEVIEGIESNTGNKDSFIASDREIREYVRVNNEGKELSNERKIVSETVLEEVVNTGDDEEILGDYSCYDD